MELKILNISKRRVAFELINNSAYYSPEKYKLFLNGEYVKDIENNVFSLNQLEPEKKYELQLKDSLGEKLISKINFETEVEYVKLNVKKFGAKGNGESDDTLSIQTAIMSCPKNSTVYIPEGVYSVKSILLKDNITIELDKNAIIKGTKIRENLSILPGFIETTDEKDEYYLGSWEGNPLDSYTSIITGINVQNVKFVGEGTIDGNAGKEDWWFDAKKKRGAWRPRTISLINCENIVFEGIKITNSPCWTVHPFYSKHLKFINMEIYNPDDSPNTDGIDPESCENIEIVGTKISVGDDCIAIKSSKIYLGKKLKKPTTNMSVRNCYMERGHGAVVIGSEIAGGVNNIKIEKCVFFNTDKGLRIKTRRGRGKDSILSEISCENIEMNEVKAPFVINSFYFCDPDGKSNYVGSKEFIPVDERTPSIGNVYFKNIKCENAHISAAFICGLPEKKIENLLVENVYISFSEEALADYPAMMLNCEKVKKQGFYVENVKKLTIKNLTVKDFIGEKIIKNNIEEANID